MTKTKRPTASTKNLDALKAKQAKVKAEMSRTADALDKLAHQHYKLRTYYDAIDNSIAIARDALANKVTVVAEKKDLNAYTLWFRNRKVQAKRLRTGWSIYENGKFLRRFEFMSEARIAIATGEI